MNITYSITVVDQNGVVVKANLRRYFFPAEFILYSGLLYKADSGARIKFHEDKVNVLIELTYRRILAEEIEGYNATV